MSSEFKGALFEWIGGILLAGALWGGVYLALQGIEYFSVELGGWKYLLYLVLGIFSLMLFFGTIEVVWNAIKGILYEVWNFTVWVICCGQAFL